jgi:thiamine transporter
VLELVSKLFIPELPFGGQVTLVSMLPVVLISYRHGVRWGLVAGMAYAMMEMLLGAKNVAAAFQPGYFGDGRMIVNALIMCLMDYFLAFTALGLGGCLRNRVEKPGLGLMLGSIVALSARYLAHILSGYILFSGWAVWFFTQDGFPAWGADLAQALSPEALGWVYSVIYNGFFMIPEIVLTAIAALAVARIPGIARKIS